MPLERGKTSEPLVECPTCHGVPQMQGDGHGWDGGGAYHSPPCETCDDRGEVPVSVAERLREGDR